MCGIEQHARPYRALVHDLVGLQRNVSNMHVCASMILTSH
jgi:hypothetical protein